jgi:hypothetical protein
MPRLNLRFITLDENPVEVLSVEQDTPAHAYHRNLSTKDQFLNAAY